MRRKKRGPAAAWAQLEDEFNDLLTPILGYSEFLQMQLDPESELIEDLQEIHSAAWRMQQLSQKIFRRHKLPAAASRQAAGSTRQGRAGLKKIGCSENETKSG